MPRGKPGGTRVGTPGTAYPNRTDLGSQHSLPVRVAEGQTYGAAQAQAEAQRTVPMAPPPLPAAGGAPAGVGGPQPSQRPMIPPGGFGDLHRPTERPSEPVTAGAALGPGPGPEALGLPSGGPAGMSALLSRAAQSTGSSTLAALAQRAAGSGQ